MKTKIAMLLNLLFVFVGIFIMGKTIEVKAEEIKYVDAIYNWPFETIHWHLFIGIIYRS